MRPLAIFGALGLLAGVLFAGFRGAGPLPPLGQLLDPVHGAWGAVSTIEHPREYTTAVPGLGAQVDIRYDARGVPHIFATSEDDLFRALGYVVARDRLFQLEVQARAGAGTLTELVGAIAAPADSEPRHLGLPRAAERLWASWSDTSLTKRFSFAYAAGVNAWIDGLTPENLPVEYKLLGRSPARWQGINALHLGSRMAWTLSYFHEEQERLAAEALVGRPAAHAIFPSATPVQEPIQPNGQFAARVDTSAIPAPGTADSAMVALLRWLPRETRPDDDDAMARIFASNNWAVAPSRSATGKALLAGDPHLELTLPSIWFEVHLVIPGRIDIHGVSIVGTPGVQIGFNRHVAWSVTNTGADVLDFYRETVDDHQRPARYLLDDVWKDIELREEVYRDQVGTIIRTDTVRFTHRGPLRRMGPDWISMRWTALEPNDIVRAFWNAEQQTTAPAFLDAMAEHFFVPAQNAIVADRSGNIAIRSTGHYPIRPDNGDGQVIRDGSVSASDWQGFWPVAEYPQALNPAQGYLASANQQPIDPGTQPRYLGYDGAFDPWRAAQINRLLRSDSVVTVDDMRSFQVHPGSVRADQFAPRFLAASQQRLAAGGASASLRGADSVLRAWDRRYTRDNTGSALFERSMQELVRRTWDELVPGKEKNRVATPSSAMLLRLLTDSVSAWWDDRRTVGRREGRDDILVASLEAAFDSVVARAGAPTAETWAWSQLGQAAAGHLLRMRGFSRGSLAIQGGPGTLNPSSGGRFGSSWRMVVELGDTIKALGVYPGGQSGNPASPRYDDRLARWQEGTLQEVYSPSSLGAMAAGQVRASLTLMPAGGVR